ncbi:MAG: PAS domain-containing protein [Aminobacterium sp.]
MRKGEWGENFKTNPPRQIALPLENELEYLEQQDDNMFQNPSLWFSASLHHPDLLVCFIDEDGRLRFWNKTAERVTGYSFEFLSGSRKWLSLLYPNAENRQRMLSSLRTLALMQGASASLETKIKRNDGKPCTILWACNNVMLSDNFLFPVLLVWG